MHACTPVELLMGALEQCFSQQSLIVALELVGPAILNQKSFLKKIDEPPYNFPEQPLLPLTLACMVEFLQLSLLALDDFLSMFCLLATISSFALLSS